MQPTDPTRIPQLIRALQEAWEGQPDLTLPAFIEMLRVRGMTWATSEEELAALLAQVRDEHPSLIDVPPTTPTLLSTTQPNLHVTLNGSRIVVRSADDPRRAPSVWTYTGLRPTGPGRPLVVVDTEGVEHRLGVVELATVLDESAAPALRGLRPADIGSARWCVVLDGGARVLVGPRLWVWRTVGRETVVETLAWEGVVKCEPGAEMEVAPARGGKPVVLGPVAEVLLLET